MRMKLCTCPKCGTHDWHKRTQQAPQGFDCAGCGAVIQGGVMRRTPAWGSEGGRSLRFAFNPKNIAKVKEDLPSAELCPKTGALIYTSEAQQKRVFKEMGRAKEKYEAKHADAAAVDLTPVFGSQAPLPEGVEQ